MDFTELSYANEAGTAVDGILDHPRLGPVPYTARQDDPEQLGRELFAWAVKSGEIVAYEPLPPADSVPPVVSMRQARLALNASGLLDEVEAAISTADKADAIEWEYATELRRDHPLIANIGGALGLSSEQVDNLFIQASKL